MSSDCRKKGRRFLYIFIFLLAVQLLLMSFFPGELKSRELELDPAMVVIENHPLSRPQAGLNEADVVYEFLVEGGVTRFLAGYFDGYPEKAGPIRSLRPYMIDIALQHGGLIFHAGASQKAHRIASQDDVYSLDEITNPWYYWRFEGRSMPHNLYTDRESLLKASEAVDIYAGSDSSNPARKCSEKNDLAEGDSAEIISLSYWSNEIEYIYDQEIDRYRRFLQGDAHILEGEITVSPEEIIIISVPHEIIDDEGRLRIDFSGEGSALLIRSGRAFNARWKGSSGDVGEGIDILTEEGEEIDYGCGLTWVQVVPNTADIVLEE